MVAHRAKPVGYTYFVVVPNHDYVKIGKANDPDSRICGLATGMPWEPACLLLLEGAKYEKFAHIAFASLRHRGEWFNLGDDLCEFIKDRQRNAHSTMKVRGHIVPVASVPDGQFPAPKPHECDDGWEGVRAWNANQVRAIEIAPLPQEELSEVEAAMKDEATRFARLTHHTRCRVVRSIAPWLDE